MKQGREKMVEEKSEYGKVQKNTFAMGSFTQWFIQTLFGSWVFSYYFVAIGLNVWLIVIAFVCFSVYNSINDPVIGYLSDKFRSDRFGRRKPFIMIGTIPITIIAIILFTPPAIFGISTATYDGQIVNFIYVLIVILLYDTAYTCVALPYDSLFPELYTSVEERSEVNTYKQIYSAIGLIIGFLLPGLLIDDLTVWTGYVVTGAVASIFVLGSLLVSLKLGVTERKEFTRDHQNEMGFFEGIKYTFKNKAFILYTIMFFCYNYILLLIADIVPLFAKHIFGVENTLLTGILAGLLFIVGIATIVIWKKIDVKHGGRKGYFFSAIAFWVAAIPILFISDIILGFIVVSIMGFGFGGMLYFNYLLIADVVDEDELKTGYRREGTFFGITNFFMRLSGVLMIVTVAIVFQGTSWAEYTPNPAVDTILGLRFLMFGMPSIALLVICIALYFYPFTKEKVDAMKADLAKMHDDKLKKVS